MGICTNNRTFPKNSKKLEKESPIKGLNLYL
jgi:hypothetical protein